MAPECEPFTIGNETAKTFNSPGYPLHYTKNISCVRVLEGERISVESSTPDTTSEAAPPPPQCFLIKNLLIEKLISAPVGYLLRLDFRDHFNIEPSDDCKFDYLEVIFSDVVQCGFVIN